MSNDRKKRIASQQQCQLHPTYLQQENFPFQGEQCDRDLLACGWVYVLILMGLGQRVKEPVGVMKTKQRQKDHEHGGKTEEESAYVLAFRGVRNGDFLRLDRRRRVSWSVRASASEYGGETLVSQN